MLDPLNAYEVILDGNGDLVGFYCRGPDARVAGGPRDEIPLDIGVGLRPDLTGQGRGRGLVEAVVRHASSQHPGRPLRVTIAAFNSRARAVWKHAGFTKTHDFQRGSDGRKFVVLTLAIRG